MPHSITLGPQQGLGFGAAVHELPETTYKVFFTGTYTFPGKKVHSFYHVFLPKVKSHCSMTDSLPRGRPPLHQALPGTVRPTHGLTFILYVLSSGTYEGYQTGHRYTAGQG